MKVRKLIPNGVPRSVRRLFPQVTEVRDATEGVLITVTAHDTAHAKRLRPEACALARAACRTFHADGAIIGMNFSYLINGKRAVRFQTPVSVGCEITSFDRHSDFATGDYKLSKVSPSQRLGLGKKKKHPSSGSRVLRRIVHHGTVRVREMDR